MIPSKEDKGCRQVNYTQQMTKAQHDTASLTGVINDSTLDMCQQRDMAVEKASTILGCDAQDGIASRIWSPSSRSLQFCTRVPRDDRQLGGSPQRGACGDEGLQTRRVAVLLGKAGMCRNRHGSEEMFNLFKEEDTLERSSLRS